MNQNLVYKEYWGVVEGHFSPESGTIDLPIQRKPGSIIERQVHPLARKALPTTRPFIPSKPVVSSSLFWKQGEPIRSGFIARHAVTPSGRLALLG